MVEASASILSRREKETNSGFHFRISTQANPNRRLSSWRHETRTEKMSGQTMMKTILAVSSILFVAVAVGIWSGWIEIKIGAANLDPNWLAAALLIPVALALIILWRISGLDKSGLEVNDKFRQFFDAIDQGPFSYLILDRDGRIQFANREFEVTSGYSSAEKEGQIYEALNSNSHSSEVHNEIWSKLQARKRWHGDRLVVRKDGLKICNRISISPILDKDGQVSQLIVVEEDVTERREASQSISTQLHWMRRLYEIVADSSHNYVDEIEQVLKLGHSVLELEHGSVRQAREGKLAVLYSAVVDGGSGPRGGQMDSPEKSICGIALGREDPLALHDVAKSEFADHPSCADGAKSYIGLPITVKNRRYGTLSFGSNRPRSKPFSEQDVSFVRLLARIVEIALERMLATNELVSAKRAAEKANRAKSEFLANMSHEIRSPLNIVLGFTQILQCDSRLNSGQLERIDAINRHGEHLLSLITDLLEMSKIEAGQIDVKPALFNLQQLLDDVESMTRTQARERGLDFRCHHGTDMLGGIVADQTRIRQVLINLLTNALKFTETGGIIFSVQVLPGLAGPGLRKLRFEVVDTGVGIAEKHQEEIFKPFEQTNTAINEGGGAGLGLAITRKIAHMLGGRLEVESIPGVGSTFLFEIDVEVDGFGALRVDPQRRQLPRLKPECGVFRILVVDDLESSRDLLEELLSAVGFEVTVASSGEEALALFENLKPDAVFMDWRMPGIGGAEATRRIKANDARRSTPVISISASALEENRLRAIECRSDAFIAKPFKIDEVLATLNAHLGVIYDLPNSEENQSPPPKTGPTSTGPELVTKVRDAAEECDRPRLLDLGEEIYPEDPAFASTLKRLAGQFQYQEVISLLKLDSAA
ncbi:MAG: two-component system sensor histidine kinase/response regulator [Verrucomicrobiales bacterium]|jgi:two-component system sensor histidine kinase/response regulator